MAEYKSKPFVLDTPAQNVAEKFSDFTRLQEYIDRLPESEREKVGDVAFTTDSIVMKTKQVGEITLKVVERTPRRIALMAVGSPVPMNLAIDITPLEGDRSEIVSSMNVDIPAMLKPMVGGTLQKAVYQFGELMKKFV